MIASSAVPGTGTDLEKIAQIWEQRRRQKTRTDYPIGPGDVLEISVPAMEELQSRTVRVSGEGTVALPFIGVIQASGLSESQLRSEIRRRLQKDYMYDPQVAVFVKEYRSRQVAVLGAVQKPGLYSLASESDTLLDMISLAGGPKKDAAPRIFFNPSESEKQSSDQNPQNMSLSSSLPPSLNPEPIVIELNSATRARNQIYLALPARPGDVITVPANGEVFVAGWVEKPGSYKISSGLTVLGAVAAAGGPLFAADTGAVKVIRMGKDGQGILFGANLAQIQSGENPDIPVQGGDIINVSASTAKVIPYSFYRFVSSVLNIGAYKPL